MHGKVDSMDHFGGTLFAGIEPQFRAVRYHSLVVECDDHDLESLRALAKATARSWR